MERYQGFARHVATGAPASGATITVTDAVSAIPASLYSDDGVTPKANPFTADLTTGYFTFYVANGRYTIAVTGSGVAAYSLADVLLHDPEDV